MRKIIEFSRLFFILTLFTLTLCSFAVDEESLVKSSYHAYWPLDLDRPTVDGVKKEGLLFVKVDNPESYKKFFGRKSPKNFNWKKKFIITIYSTIDQDQKYDYRIRVPKIVKEIDKKGRAIFWFYCKKMKVVEPNPGPGIRKLIPKAKVPQITLEVSASPTVANRIELVEIKTKK